MAASSSMIRIRWPVSSWGGGGAAEMASVASDMRGFPQHRKFKIERGSGAQVACYVYLPGVFLDNAVCDGKTEARSTSLSLYGRGLGGEERIVDPLQMFRRDTRAGIGDGDADVSVHLGGNAQRSAVFHGVFRVQKQIQKHLLQLVLIAENWRQIGHQRGVELHSRRLKLMFHERKSFANNRV